jgi:Short C-terminal domain
MLGSRRGRPSLIRSAAQTAGRTAVVVGTANAMSRPRGGAAPAPQAAPQAAMAEPAPAGGLTEATIGKLKQLAELQQAGILTEAEFQEQKARLLA